MKITLEKYNSEWTHMFEEVKADLDRLLGFLTVEIEHIGSTSVEGLSAKPILDVLVGVSEESELAYTILPLTGNNYVYYQVYNGDMPYRRFFVKHIVDPEVLFVPTVIEDQENIPSSTWEHSHRIAHIHILQYNSVHWIRHIAFRNYLRTYPEVRERYQSLKEALSGREWSDGNEYNAAKDKFLKTEEKKAVNLYSGRKNAFSAP